MIHFTLFGIPIYIRPTFWIVLAIFGGILGVSSVESLIYPALFVIAGFIAILSHELGHALVGRKLGGGQQTIILELFGGVTSSHGMQLTRAGRVLMILAGPMMTLVLGVISILVAWNIVGPVLTANGKDFWDLVLYPYLATAVSPKLYILSCLIMIGEWWDCPQPASHLSPGRRPAGRPIRPLPQKSIHDRVHHLHRHRPGQLPALPRLLYPHIHGPLCLQQLPGI